MNMPAYFNGKFLPLDQVAISPLDRGFLFADSVYDVLAVINKKIVAFSEHIQRLNKSLEAIGMHPVRANDQWHAILSTLIEEGPSKDQLIYIQVTRGPEAIRTHSIPQTYTPTVLAYTCAWKRHHYLQEGPYHVITASDNRWENPYIKANVLLPNILLRTKATEHKAEDVLLFNEQKQLREATSANVFIVKNNQVLTPSLSKAILPGITRKLVIKACQNAHIQFKETQITFDEVMAADEIWLTSTTREIMPVTQVNNQPIGQEKIGPVWQLLQPFWQDLLERI